MKAAGATGPFKIGLDAERAGLHTRCNESPAMMRAKPAAGKRLSDQGSDSAWPARGGQAERRAAKAAGTTGGVTDRDPKP